MDPFRIKKVSEQVSGSALIDDPIDLFYLTGLPLSKGRLLIKPEGATLFVDGRYYELARKEAPCTVALWDEQKKLRETRIEFDSAATPYEEYLSLKHQFPDTEWIPTPQLVKKVRMIKDSKEIQSLKKAAGVTWRGYRRVVECLKEGVSEEELAFEFEVFCRKNGASRLSFEPIIAFGENSAYPHHRAGKSRLRNHQVVLIDVGAVVDHYHGDLTRIVYFGKPDPQVARLEEIVRRAQKKAVESVRPGLLVSALNQIVNGEFEKEDVKQLYMHSLGHGIGLETHELPQMKSGKEDLPLKVGMVFTIEPGLYQPGVGGIRIEDMVRVTETGYENLYDEL